MGHFWQLAFANHAETNNPAPGACLMCESNCSLDNYKCNHKAQAESLITVSQSGCLKTSQQILGGQGGDVERRQKCQ